MHFEAFIHFQFIDTFNHGHPSIITSNFMNYELILLEWREICGERKPTEKTYYQKKLFPF